jgi:23S rRNA pseudouridine2605 synthase
MALQQGVTVDGVRYGSIQATLDQSKGANSWLSMSLREGKNREIRRVIEYLGGKVTRLIRIGYGPFELGDLPRGAVEEVAPKILRTQLGGLLTGVESAPKQSPSDKRRAERREAERLGKDAADADRRG